MVAARGSSESVMELSGLVSLTLLLGFKFASMFDDRGVWDPKF